MAEYWDIYNENRVLTGRTIKRGDAFAEGEYYVCCEAWIINSRNELLMTQRHPNKKAGGLWEFTGGGVLAGESSKQAAVREIKEELGIDIEEAEVNLLEVYQNKNYFMDIYVIRKDFDLEQVILAPNEVIDAKWMSGNEIAHMIAENKVVKSVAARYEMYNKIKIGDT